MGPRQIKQALTILEKFMCITLVRFNKSREPTQGLVPFWNDSRCERTSVKSIMLRYVGTAPMKAHHHLDSVSS